MQQDSSFPEPVSWPISAFANSDLLCLRFHSAQLKILANYEALLQATIFGNPTKGVDEKALKKHRRILKTISAYQILALLWKESNFVDQQTLALLGMRKLYEKGLTAHHLAADLAESGSEVATLNSRIRNIGIAASCFDLIERVSLTSTNVPLKGTALRLKKRYMISRLGKSPPCFWDELHLNFHPPKR
jgi:hypothetical protein